MVRLWFTLVACVVLGPPAQAQDAQAQDVRMPPHMAVLSDATAEVTPDVAVLRLGVSTERRTAADAADANARAARAVLDEVGARGVEARDVRTTSVTLTPVYAENRDPTGRAVKRTLAGYLARNTLEVRVRDLPKAGAVAQALIDRGANILQGLEFEIGDEAARLDALRAEAIREAVRRAGRYAEAAGVRLGRVVEINPDPSGSDGGAADLPLRRASPAEASIPVAPGTRTLRAQARVVWELVQ